MTKTVVVGAFSLSARRKVHILAPRIRKNQHIRFTANANNKSIRCTANLAKRAYTLHHKRQHTRLISSLPAPETDKKDLRTADAIYV